MLMIILFKLILLLGGFSGGMLGLVFLIGLVYGYV